MFNRNEPKPKSRLEIAHDAYREEHPWEYPEPDPPRNGCAMAFCFIVLAYVIVGCLVAHIMK